MVLRRVKARYSNGLLEPREPLVVDEGVEIDVFVDEEICATGDAGVAAPGRAIVGGPTRSRPQLTAEEARERMRSLAGAWKSLDDPDELIRMIYEARITGSRVPPDL